MLVPDLIAGTTKVFDVPDGKAITDNSDLLRKVIDRASSWQKKHPSDSVIVRLSPDCVYNISRDKALTLPYYVSNTTSDEENPDNPNKHVGLLFKDLKNFTFDGNGATLLTHGEITPWVVDNCTNLTLCSLTIDASDPTVPEMVVTETDELTFVAQTNVRTSYTIKDGELYWKGDGWEFNKGIAQYYDPTDSVTLRCQSPLVEASRVEEISPGILRFVYSKPHGVKKGISFQMRHSFRTEVAGLISQSEQITLADLNLRFMGNFGIVAQVSSDITYSNLVCAPDTPVSGRYNAGFADFLQVSGCKGNVVIEGCKFAGSHDDPINIHGTHLKVSGWDPESTTLYADYCHPQTFGFQSFFPGDTVAFVNSHTLIQEATAVVKEAEMVNPHKIKIILTAPCSHNFSSDDIVVENLTWCPSVRISGNEFTLTPTRGILITTYRPVIITGNRFVKIPMASILIADDARSWFESGPVKNLTISDNEFIDCSAPQILISPENDIISDAVHRNITINANRFVFNGPSNPFGQSRAMIKARSVDGLILENNYVTDRLNIPSQLILDDCRNVRVDRF